MQGIKLLLKGLIIVAIAMLAVSLLLPVILWLFSAEFMNEDLAYNNRARVHWLPANKSLSYQFAANRTRELRVLSNAIVESNISDEKPLHYAIKYQLLDSSNRTLHQGVYHHSAKIQRDENQHFLKLVMDEKQTFGAASGQSFYLNQTQFSSATKLLLEFVPENKDFIGLVVRVHAKTPHFDEDPNKVWLQQPQSWRQRVASFHSLGGDALSSQEKYNASAFHWLKLAPIGIPNIDFTSDLLYETLPRAIAPYEEPEALKTTTGYYIDTKLSLSFSVSAPQTNFLINLTEPNEQLSFVWHDPDSQLSPRALTAQRINELQYVLKSPPLGLVTIHSQAANYLSIIEEQTKQQPITVLHSQYYQVDAQSSAEFSVVSGSDIELDWRAEEGVRIKLAFYSSETPRDATQFTTASTLSNYDRLVPSQATPPTQVEEPQKRYITVPRGINRAIVSAENALVKLRSRHRSFHYLQTLCTIPCPETSEINAWFSQYADNHHLLAAQDKLAIVRLFKAPLPATEQRRFQSVDLDNMLAISNTALLPLNELAAKTEQRPFAFRKVSAIDAKVLKPQQTYPSKTIVVKNQPPYIQQFEETVPEQFSQPNIEAIYINQGLPRTHIQTRLYKIDANKRYRISLPKKLAPTAVVIKTLAQSANLPITLKTKLNVELAQQPSTDYTLTNKIVRLNSDQQQSVVFFTPKTPKLFMYPSVTLTVQDDVKQTLSVELEASHSVWISVLTDAADETEQLIWWTEDV
ncbi:hypothetical protein ACSLBF_12525 [Pseudoalteromonas sp. T1lg65]|uniref:hypothetical protein n=1 Tax=Pseudoalteromonas sp. T1lg65 TaxID=2077101 RepID=UPI003F7A9F10